MWGVIGELDIHQTQTLTNVENRNKHYCILSLVLRINVQNKHVNELGNLKLKDVKFGQAASLINISIEQIYTTRTTARWYK